MIDPQSPPNQTNCKPLLGRFKGVIGVSSSVMIALAGSLGATAQAAWAEVNGDRVLLAQQIVDGLPPPPGTPFGAQSLPPAQFQQPAQQQSVQVPSLDRSPANPSSVNSRPSGSSSSLDQRYLVLVNGDSPLLLEQVRKIESGAFLQDYDGRRVIQAGLFAEPNRAERQVQALETQGIGAEVISIAASLPPATSFNPTVPASTVPEPELLPATPPPTREVIFGQQPNFDASGSSTNATLIAAASSYYVVIPGREIELPAISDQVIRLGEGYRVASVIQERQSPLGPHVLLGPFVNRRAAERWNRYLRAFGMDARVYYRR